MNTKDKELSKAIVDRLRDEIENPYSVAWARCEMVDGVSISGLYRVTEEGVVCYVMRSDELDELMYKLWEETLKQDHDWAELTVRLAKDGDAQFYWNTEAGSDGVLEGRDRTDQWCKEYLGDAEIRFPD